MQTIVTKNDLQIIKQAISACRGCTALECMHCPMHMRPGKLLHLVDSYEALINHLEMAINEYRGE